MSVRRKSLLTLIVIPVVVLMTMLVLGVANAARPSSHPGQVAKVAKITISMYAYTGPGSVKPGARIRVAHHDSVQHTVTSDTDGLFNIAIPARRTNFFNAPATAGRYKFHCIIHNHMHGVLSVK